MSDSQRQAVVPLPDRIAGLLADDLRTFDGGLDTLFEHLERRGWHVGLIAQYAGPALARILNERQTLDAEFEANFRPGCSA